MFKLVPNPTFKFNVKFPVAGQDADAELTVTFRYVRLKEWQKRITEVQALLTNPDTVDGEAVQAELLMEIMESWAFPEPLTLENVKALVLNYPQSFLAITGQFVQELVGVRTKN